MGYIIGATFSVAIIGNLSYDYQETADQASLFAFVMAWGYLVRYQWSYTAYSSQTMDNENVDLLREGRISPELFDVLQSEESVVELYHYLSDVPDSFDNPPSVLSLTSQSMPTVKSAGAIVGGTFVPCSHDGEALGVHHFIFVPGFGLMANRRPARQQVYSGPFSWA